MKGIYNLIKMPEIYVKRTRKRKLKRGSKDEKRSTMPASMERDLFAHAADFLSVHFRDRLTDADKLSLEQWMTSQLEAERKGWKSSLQRSLQEVEKERKRAIDIDVRIEDLNTKMKGYMKDLQIVREPSMYQSSDRDIRSLNIQELERNMDTILKTVKAIFTERVQSFKLLNSAPESGKPLDELVSELLAKFPNEEDDPDVPYKDQVLKLNRDIEYLLKSEEEHENQIKEKDLKHLNEIDALTQIIARQRDQLDAILQIEKQDKSTQVKFSPRSKTVGVQTKVESDSLGSTFIGNERDLKSEKNKHFPSPIKSITITKSQDFEAGKKRRYTVHSQEFGRVVSSTSSTPHKHSEEFEETKSNFSKPSLSANSGPSSTPRNTVDSLRGQVVEFAVKLEKAKEEVELYQRQLAWMKSTPHAALINQEVANIRNAYTNNKYQDGYLSGTRKDILPAVYRSPDVLMLRSQLRAKARKYAPIGAANNASRCLRCYKLFKVRENHRKACRYHPRGKKKVEKYDSSGRLETVAYLWECCLQGTEAIGCANGEHV